MEIPYSVQYTYRYAAGRKVVGPLSDQLSKSATYLSIFSYSLLPTKLATLLNISFLIWRWVSLRTSFIVY